MTDDATTTPDDEHPTEQTEPVTEEQPTVEAAAAAPVEPEASAAEPLAAATPDPAPAPAALPPHARRGFDKRTAGFTAIGISALLIAFVGGYALGDHHGGDDGPHFQRAFAGGPGGGPGMPGRGGPGGGPSFSGPGERGELRGGFDGRDGGGRGGRRGDLRLEMRGNAVVGAITDIDGDEVTVKPVRGGDEVTADKDDVKPIGPRFSRGDDSGDDNDELEVGDIVVVPDASDDSKDDSGD
jgi:hypothetical protein